MFQKLKEINLKPEPFQFYTVKDLWADEHISKQMLKYHLNGEVDISSRNRKFIEGSVKWIVSRFNVNQSTGIADFGCGPGLYTSRFAKHSNEVTGIDFSSRSIQYARDQMSEEGLHINYVLKNYLEFESERKFDLITMIMCDFCALSPTQRKKLLFKFYHLLKPGGSVLLDVYSLNSFDKRTELSVYEYNPPGGFWSSDANYVFTDIFKYNAEKVVLDKYSIIETYRNRVIYNWLQYFCQKSLKEEFKQAGFQVEELFSDVAGTPFDSNSLEMAIVATRRD